MKIKFHTITDGKFRGGTKDYTTCGYWYWEKPNNRGTLHVEVVKYQDWRYALAVWGHELIEAAWCWLRGITTEQCDFFDDLYEQEYEEGKQPLTSEGGFDKRCPYRVGHVLGSWWERLAIHATFASWTAYDQACNFAMGIDAPAGAPENPA